LSNPIILITGSGGQIGTVLTSALRKIYGEDSVIASDLQPVSDDGQYEQLDVTDGARLTEIIQRHKITQVYHLAALLSSSGEKNIDLTWKVNFDAHKQLLKICHENNVNRIFYPSTIGIYGPTTPRQQTPQHSSFQPVTIYGISKITGELWNEYYRNRYGLDIRSLRYPGVISYEVIPSGGTTDFSVEMFFDLFKKGHYDCYLKSETRLPMIYMPDVLKGTLALMTAESENISTSMGYNLAGFSLSPMELYQELKKYLPEATIGYQPDHRQKIAESWSETIDDSLARQDWGWKPSYNLSTMTADMVEHIRSLSV